MPPKNILILGGTSDGAALACHLSERFAERARIIVSYSGVTGHQPDLPCEIRVGGFGGTEGLIEYIKNEAIDFLIDATHPFAKKISGNVSEAVRTLGLPAVIFHRPPWDETPQDTWHHVSDMDAAARKVAQLAKPTFLSIGVKELNAFQGLGEIPLLVRLLKKPEQSLKLDRYQIVCARPPFTLEDEKQLMGDHNIRLLVTKNSGGDKTASKIEAARALGVEVIMVDRPASEPLEHIRTIPDIVEWLRIRGL